MRPRRGLVCALLILCARAESLTAQQPPGAPQSAQAERQRAEDERMRTDWAQLKRYRAANDSLRAPAPGERRVVFMGNSITEGWARHFPAMFPGKPYIGRGISGQTT